MSTTKLKVLVAPLDWGLGHATRCIPIIRELIKQNVEVLLCASGEGKNILAGEFPSLTFINIPGITVKYPKHGSMTLSMLLQMPQMLNAIRKEYRMLNACVEKYRITHIVSDNRYGLFSSKAKTAFITHQLCIKSSPGTKFLEPLLRLVNKMFINKFNELWIPDQPPPENLSGGLSNTSSIKIKIKYLGILSRFHSPANSSEKIYDIIALLSGPEPQRTLLEEKLTPYLRSTGQNCLLIQGLPSQKTKSNDGNVETIASIGSSHLESILHPGTLLISRPGYSTVMDVAILQHQRLLFIPTPGQTEQEYIADHLFHMYGVRYIRQHESFPDFRSIDSGRLPFRSMPEKLEESVRKFLFE